MQNRVALLVFLALCSLAVYGQIPFERDYSIKTEEQVDSVFQLMNAHAEYFRENEQWDSLIYLLVRESNLSERWQSKEIRAQQIERIVMIADEKMDSIDHAYLYAKNTKAFWLNVNHEFNKAIKISNDVVQIAEEEEILDQKGVALANKAFSLANLIQLDEAESTALEALEIFKTLVPDTFRYIQIYQILGNVNSYQRNFDEALSYNYKILELTIPKYGVKHPNVGIVNLQIGDIFSEKEDYKGSLTYYLKAQKSFTNYYIQSGSSDGLIVLSYNLGTVYSDVGEYDLSESHFLYGLGLSKKSYGEYSNFTLQFYIELARNALQTNNLEKVQYYINAAKDVQANSPDLENFYKLLISNQEVKLALAQENFQRANSLVINELNNFEYTNITDSITLYSNLFLIHEGLGHPDTTSVYLNLYEQSSLELYGPTHFMYFTTLAYALEYYANQEDHEQVDKIWNKILNSIPNPKRNAKYSDLLPNQSLFDIGVFYANYLRSELNKGRYDLQSYRAFVEDFETYYEKHLLVVQSNSRLSKEGHDLKKVYAPLVESAFQNNSHETILLVEKLKAILTKMLLQNRLLGEIRNINERFSVANELLQEYQDSSAIELYNKMFTELAKIQIYKDSLYKNDKIEFQQLFNIDSPTFEEIKSVLQPGELMIEYLRIDSILYCLKLSNVHTEFDKIDYKKVEEKISLYNHKRTKHAMDLYNFILPGTLHKSYDKWLILPDGILYNLNFEALQNNESQFLIENKKIRYAYSAETLLFQDLIDETLDNQKDILAFTPGFEEELKKKFRSDSLFQYLVRQPFLLRLTEELKEFPNSTLFSAFDASESNYNSTGKDYKIVHFGTHGIINQYSPQFSKLILTKDSLEDGQIYAYELYGQQINTNLAVLASCSSGKQLVQSSDGFVSITQAFTHAQCPSVLMTLWDVDERSTAQILSEFYKNLRKGQLKSEALRNAKLEFINNADEALQDPYYWAGLAIIGSDSALYSRFDRKRWLLALVLFIVLGFAIVLWYKRKK